MTFARLSIVLPALLLLAPQAIPQSDEKASEQADSSVADVERPDNVEWDFAQTEDRPSRNQTARRNMRA